MFGILVFALISTYDFSLGYSLSWAKNQETKLNRTLLPRRQDFFSFGSGFELWAFQDWNLGLRPEILFQHALVGLQTWLEIERSIEIGPRHDALSIVFGAQQGWHTSWILDSSNTEADFPGSRGSFALGSGLFLGPRVQLSRNYSLSAKFGTQLFWGQIARTGFRSPWGTNWGILGMVSMGLGFSPTEERDLWPDS